MTEEKWIQLSCTWVAFRHPWSKCWRGHHCWFDIWHTFVNVIGATVTFFSDTVRITEARSLNKTISIDRTKTGSDRNKTGSSTYAIRHNEGAIIGSVGTACSGFLGSIIDSGTTEFFSILWLRHVR